MNCQFNIFLLDDHDHPRGRGRKSFLGVFNAALLLTKCNVGLPKDLRYPRPIRAFEVNLFAICAARSLVAPRYLRFVMEIESVSSVLRSLHRTMGCCRCCFRKGDWDRPSCVHACKYGGEGEVTAFIVFCNSKY